MTDGCMVGSKDCEILEERINDKKLELEDQFDRRTASRISVIRPITVASGSV